MFSWLLPKEINFFNLFEKHAVICLRSAQELLTLLSTSPIPSSGATLLKALEHDADIITQECIESLHKTFITPFERDEIYQLISRLDDIVDEIENTSNCIVTYKIDHGKEEAIELASILLEAVENIVEAVGHLRNTKNAGLIREKCILINRIENKGDDALRKALIILFDKEPHTRDIIKWKDIYESLEEAIDRCADVANILNGIILEQN